MLSLFRFDPFVSQELSKFGMKSLCMFHDSHYIQCSKPDETMNRIGVGFFRTILLRIEGESLSSRYTGCRESLHRSPSAVERLPFRGW